MMNRPYYLQLFCSQVMISRSDYELSIMYQNWKFCLRSVRFYYNEYGIFVTYVTKKKHFQIESNCT